MYFSTKNVQNLLYQALNKNSFNDPSKVLANFVDQISKTVHLSEITQSVTETARNLTGADGITFVLREDNQCYYADENAISPLWKNKRFPSSACISGWAMENKKAVIIRDIYQDERIPHDAYRFTFVKSLCIIPIRIENPVGVIGAYWKNEHTPSQEETKILQIIANCTSTVFENLELKASIQKKTHQNNELEKIVHYITHDLKNPLASIIGFVELIQIHLKEKLDDKTNAYLEGISSTSMQVGKQIDTLISLHRLNDKKLKKQKTNLSQMAQKVFESLSLRNVVRKVDFTVEPELYCFADPNLLKIMLENLISNAMKYTFMSQNPEIKLKQIVSNNNLTSFCIQDNGVGFDQADSSELFRPFVRLSAHSHIPGTGLGLASAAHIIKLHDGQIWAEGKKNEGACFYFSLPVSQDA